MRFFSFIAVLTICLALGLATDNGLQKVVTWDNGSLLIDGDRIIIMAGEFHYQRLPVPELWLDVFQKFKANGMNTVSLYFFWSYHSASRGVYDFESPGKNVQMVFDAAKQAGLYVIARPGPYCNAETNAGGFALWTSDGSGGKYRTSDATYQGTWTEWIDEIGPIIAKNQITNDGPVIMVQVENELQETTYEASNTLVIYMEQLKTAFKRAGIVVPLTHNEKGMRGMSWSTDYKNVGGAVDVYGLDSYPGGLSCTNLDSGFNVVRTYYQWFQQVSFTQPEYMPEFEGGWFSAWGASSFYDQCAAELGTEFADVYYKDIIAQRVSLLALYMTFGGTNWGHSAAPVVYSSYDYSAPLRETREIRDKFRQYKLLSLFTRVSQGLLNTFMESNGTKNAVSNSAIWTWVLKSRDTGGRFYLAENNKTSSRAKTDFSLTAKTSAGDIKISTLQLNGRQSRWVVTDYPIGNQTLLFSSAEVLTYGLFGHPVIVFYTREGQEAEFAFKNGKNVSFKTYGAATALNSSEASAYTRFSFTQAKGATIVQFSNGVLAYLLDIPTAFKFFAPPTNLDPHVKVDKQIFVLGPYLVRSAMVEKDTVSFVGDSSNSTSIEVYGGKQISQVIWNGVSLPTKKTPYGSLVGNISGAEKRKISLPTLENFKVANSLPEVSPTYDDTNWITANKTTTLAVTKPLTLPVLYSSDYKFYIGAKVYRGYFTDPSAAFMNLTVQGGLASGWTAFLNGQFLGYHPGNASASATNAILSFKDSKASLKDTNNVILVVTDYNGHDETSTGPAGAENPRGILGAQLMGADNAKLSFDTWKIQGNAGGEKNIDKTRGPMNEGGLYGERLGWHLPGFDTGDWEEASPIEDGVTGAGIRWFTTNFELDIDEDLDVPLGVELDAAPSTVARVLLYVNGYQYGKYLPHIGPQTRFPVPPGIINSRGKNTLSIALWSQTDKGAKLSTVKLIEYGKYVSGFDFGMIDGKRLQPGWKDRSQYA